MYFRRDQNLVADSATSVLNRAKMNPHDEQLSRQHAHAMKRRAFLKTSLATTALAGLTPGLAMRSRAAEGDAGRDFYELRLYHLEDAADRTLLDTYLAEAAIPALNRLGVKNVGVFTDSEPDRALVVSVLIPYPSVEVFATATDRLAADEAYLRQGEAYLSSPISNPAFRRVDSWFLRAFAGIPRTELPAFSRERKPRIFELRTYESHSESKALKKIQMFDVGEIQAMREAGLGPIFFGQALVGADLPHLTYLLSAEDREAHKAHWEAFGKHPTWQRLLKDPQYADTVSKITNWFLQPTSYSQI